MSQLSPPYVEASFYSGTTQDMRNKGEQEKIKKLNELTVKELRTL